MVERLLMQRTATTLLLIVTAVFMSACVSTEELYAQYDDQLCPVEVEPALGGAVHMRVVDRITRDTFEFPPEIFFANDVHLLDQEAETELGLAAAVLARYPTLSIEVLGFTSRRGGFNYNRALAQRRVDAVASFLQARGVSLQRIVLGPMGIDARAIADDAEILEGVQRRVSLRLLDQSGRALRPEFHGPDRLKEPVRLTEDGAVSVRRRISTVSPIDTTTLVTEALSSPVAPPTGTAAVSVELLDAPAGRQENEPAGTSDGGTLDSSMGPPVKLKRSQPSQSID